MSRAPILLACAVLALAAAGLQGQDPPPAGEAAAATPPDEVFVESIDVNVVNLLVWVTDKQGEPITGLTRDDFELFEEGRPVTITNFFAVAGGEPAPGIEVDELDLPAEEAPPLPYLAVAEDQRLNLIVYVDNFNLAPANRNRVLRRLKAFLYETVDREDRVMVVSHDRSLNIRQGFTNDPDQALSALAELEAMSGNPPDRASERLRVLQEIEGTDDPLLALADARSHADYIFTEMQFTLRRLRELIGPLSGLQGRKALLYVSDGLPMTAGEDLFIAVEDRFPRVGARAEAMSFDLQPEFRRLGAQANSAGVTFYTLDAGGAELHGSLSAADPGTVQGGSRIAVDSIFNANMQEPLHMMADATGGLAVTNTNAVERSLDRVARDFDNYYSLGFPSPHGRNGRYYELTVKVKRPGAKVRYRRGYRDRSRETLMADGSLASLYFDYERNTIGARLVFDAPTRRDDGNYLVPLAVQVPLDKLTLVPQGEHHVGRFQVAFAVMDDKGEVSPVQQGQPLSVRIPEADIERALRSHYTFETQLLMRRGSSKVAVGIFDTVADQASFVSEIVSIDAG